MPGWRRPTWSVVADCTRSWNQAALGFVDALQAAYDLMASHPEAGHCGMHMSWDFLTCGAFR
ncbi:hypothetical protein RGR602_PC01722 (plasmid) [Rhizobium gallicum bv. gallicum R602sp]|uniref:Uncharacterized protein n=1 Tax=Rhizobium gallicum bv. gallicum R602sp TaxID=1041138 RepID=A0A0B4XF76_9HYPH|nr:hypothetical protein RGR602_PC01722 [Rhizobium gallicum bv. gallicum R602sp]